MADHESPFEGEDELRAELSSADINDLPDSDFAYIEPGGKKDAEGKTVPRSLRHFPIHDAAHARNALARAPQSPFGKEAMPKIVAACKKFGIDVAQKNQALISAERRKKERHRAVPLLPEVRHFRATSLEVRSAAKTDEIIISGSPIVYDTPYSVTDMFGQFEERMAPGVASDALSRGADVRLLLNHDGLPLARSTAGTMTLIDGVGSLDFEARLDARQQLANDLAIAIERGDVTQMSCGFIVGADEWNEDMDQRTIYRFADLLDVSAVTYPASPTTSIQIAKRMALEMPIESRARVRKLYVDIRAGKVMSSSNQDKLVGAVKTLHQVLDSAGYDPHDLIGDETFKSHVEPDGDEETPEVGTGMPNVSQEDDGTIGGPNESSPEEPVLSDGTGIRSNVTNIETLRLQLETRKRRRIAA